MVKRVVICSWTVSCGWQGEREAETLKEALADPCPKCGAHVRTPKEGELRERAA
jgi:hypothetical protein